jgi:hypothetical protein
MIDELISEIRSMDLIKTEMEGDDWCIAVDELLQRSGDLIEHLHCALLSISDIASSAKKGRTC